MANRAESNDTKAQATEVAYELHTLGWKAFQNLCVTITGEVWGQTVQSFFDSRDGGRDGAFRGTWKTKAGESFKGSFTVQCKFTAKANQQLKLTDLNDELTKAKRLAAQGLADNYFLFTNARITGSADEAMRGAFQSFAGIEHFAAYGAERISLFIRESSRLRVLVPHIYGLGDLSQILDQRACDQAREILSALGDDLAKFVITEAYQRSAKALLSTVSCYFSANPRAENRPSRRLWVSARSTSEDARLSRFVMPTISSRTRIHMNPSSSSGSTTPSARPSSTG